MIKVRMEKNGLLGLNVQTGKVWNTFRAERVWLRLKDKQSTFCMKCHALTIPPFSLKKEDEPLEEEHSISQHECWLHPRTREAIILMAKLEFFFFKQIFRLYCSGLTLQLISKFLFRTFTPKGPRLLWQSHLHLCSARPLHYVTFSGSKNTSLRLSSPKSCTFMEYIFFFSSWCLKN